MCMTKDGFMASFIRWLELLFLLGWTTVHSLPDIVRIGGLFDTEDEDLELSFRYAIDRINADDTLLPRSRLSARIERLKPHDSFHASKIVCKLLDEGVAAIFGPFTPSSSTIVESTCEVMEFPHLEAQWKYRQSQAVRTINLYPDAATLSSAYLDVVNTRNWKTFTVVYEEDEDLIRLQDVLKAPSLSKVHIALKQLKPGQSYKKLIKDIKKTGETNIVLDIPIEKVIPVLREAAEVKMLTEYNNYLITSLDLHTLPAEDWQGIVSNVTGLRLVDPDRQEVNSALRDWIFGELRFGRKVSGHQQMKTSTALLYDALTLFAKALNDLDRSQTINIKSLSCAEQQPWTHGNSVVNYMRMINIGGLTGVVQFDETGKRVDFTLDIIDLKRDGLRKVGTWNRVDRINMTELFSTAFSEAAHNLAGKTLRVTTIVNPPYTMVKTDYLNRTGNDRYKGYNLDLMEELAKELNFTFEFNLVKDGSYGSVKPNGDWGGMMGELITREADVAVADLTITSQRAEAVDFTLPFMKLGIGIMFKRVGAPDPNLFSFMSPFSIDVWLYMCTAYLGVSLFIFVLARFTPYEWVNPHPCEQETEEYENQFNLQNSLWFTIGALMQQGSDLAPRAMTTRLLGLFWYFFTLIMIATYTANLAAFLTAGMMSSPIENANDLAKQTKIAYGCVASGSTKLFFKNNKNEPFKRMWAFMESSRPTVFADNNDKGVDRVLKGNYAFLMESTSIEYRKERNCQLVQIGGLLDNKGYGIATPPGSPYRVVLSKTITRLQEEGVLGRLKEKWWKGEGSVVCGDSSKSASTGELGLANVGGCFVVLIAGVSFGILVVIGEFIWKTHKIPRECRDSMFKEFLKELKFVITFRGSERPVPKSESASVNESIKMLPLKLSHSSATLRTP